MLIIRDRIYNLLKEYGISKEEFCADIGITEKALSNWNEVYPHSDNLLDAAIYLKVSMDYLIGITDDRGPYASHIVRTGAKQKLVDYFDKLPLSDEQINIIYLLIEELKNFEV